MWPQVSLSQAGHPMDWKVFRHVLALEKCCRACPALLAWQTWWGRCVQQDVVMSSTGLDLPWKCKSEHRRGAKPHQAMRHPPWKRGLQPAVVVGPFLAWCHPPGHHRDRLRTWLCWWQSKQGEAGIAGVIFFQLEWKMFVPISWHLNSNDLARKTWSKMIFDKYFLHFFCLN